MILTAAEKQQPNSLIILIGLVGVMCVTLNDVTAEGLTPGRNGKFISFRKHFPNGQDRAAVLGNIALCGRGNGSA